MVRLTDTMTGIAANEPNFPLVEPDFCGLPERTLACNLNSAGLKCRGLIEISMVQVFKRMARRGRGERETRGVIRDDSLVARASVHFHSSLLAKLLARGLFGRH